MLGLVGKATNHRPVEGNLHLHSLHSGEDGLDRHGEGARQSHVP